MGGGERGEGEVSGPVIEDWWWWWCLRSAVDLLSLVHTLGDDMDSHA